SYKTACRIPGEREPTNFREFSSRIVAKRQIVAAVHRFEDCLAVDIELSRDRTPNCTGPRDAGWCAACVSVMGLDAARVSGLTAPSRGGIVGRRSLTLIERCTGYFSR